MTEVEGDKLVIEFDDEEVDAYELTVAKVLECLVGPPHDAEQHQEAPPTAEEEASASELWFKKSRKQTLKKNNKSADEPTLRAMAAAEWPKLPEERRLFWVRKLRAPAAASGAAAATSAAERLLQRGTCVLVVISVGLFAGMQAYGVSTATSYMPPCVWATVEYDGQPIACTITSKQLMASTSAGPAFGLVTVYVAVSPSFIECVKAASNTGLPAETVARWTGIRVSPTTTSASVNFR